MYWICDILFILSSYYILLWCFCFVVVFCLFICSVTNNGSFICMRNYSLFSDGFTYYRHFQLAATFCAVIQALFILNFHGPFSCDVDEQPFPSSFYYTQLFTFNSLTDRFLMVSHNILGDDNAVKHRDLYPNIPSSFLEWNRRLHLICEELRLWQPDIVCLQVAYVAIAQFHFKIQLTCELI